MSAAPSVLEPGGVLARELGDYEDRPGQRRMAMAVESALHHGGIAIIEAGTGTGKTLAYLIPAVLSGLRVVVSTGTKALQDQIIRSDIPLVQTLVPEPFSAQMVKGASNYLCRRRFAEALFAPGDAPTMATLQRLDEWTRDTATGDRNELVGMEDEGGLWGRISTSAHGRLGGRCPHFERCFVTQARRRAESAQIVVVNHHLFFADLAVRAAGDSAKVLPDYDAVIFDEAHLVEGALTEHFAAEVSTTAVSQLYGELLALARRLGGERGGLWVADRTLEAEVGDIEVAWRTLVGTIRAQLGGASGRQRVDDALFTGPVRDAWYAVDNRLARIGTRLEERSDERDDTPGRESEVLARRALDLRNALAAVADSSDHTYVRFAEVTAHRLVLKAAPVDVSSLFARLVLDRGTPVVLTSATLSCAGSFEFLRRRLGIEEDRGDELRIESPFDYGQQALLYVATDLPDPREEEYPAACVARIAELVDITRGRSLVLFTSHRLLQRAARDLREWLGYPVLVQGDAAPAILLDEFRRCEESVLLATGTFWQGIDVPGEALSQVIIDKLPFAPPDDPLASARARREAEADRDPFYDYQVPEAAIAFCQGVGRLIRRQDDRGLVSVLDRRLLGRRYGRVFLESLPAELGRTASIERARRWWDDVD